MFFSSGAQHWWTGAWMVAMVLDLGEKLHGAG